MVMVNPHHVNKSKELEDNSPTKNDLKDAKVIANLIKYGSYAEPNLPTEIYAELACRDELTGATTEGFEPCEDSHSQLARSVLSRIYETGKDKRP